MKSQASSRPCFLLMESSLPSEMSHDPKNSRYDEESAKTHKKYREIIETLHTDHGWMIGVNNYLHLYEGFWQYSKFLGEIMSAQEHFSAQPTDIVLSSAPKSGTTWLKALAFAVITRTRFDHSSSPLLTTMPHDCIPFLEIDLAHQNPNKKDPELPLLATHIPYASLPKSIINSGCKIVYIYRDPKDAFISLWCFLWRRKAKDSELLSLEESFKLFCKGVSYYGPYWDHVLGYYKVSLERPDKVLIMKYEDLMSDTAYYVKKLAEFMGCSFSLEEEKDGTVDNIVELCSFENLSNLKVNKTGKHRSGTTNEIENNRYFRRGKTEDWKNHLTTEMAEEMDQITEQKFGNCGLT